MAFLRYYRNVWYRAWQEAWRIVITHSLKTVARDAVLGIVALGILFYFRATLVSRGYMSGDNAEDTAIYIIIGLVALVAVFAVVFVVEGLFIVHFQTWSELNSQVEYAAEKDTTGDLAAKIQSGEWQIAYPRDHTRIPNWTIRELFYHIRPDLLDDTEQESWDMVGQDVLDKLSTGELRAWGRLNTNSAKRTALAPISQSFWTDAEWTYNFLANGHDQLAARHDCGPRAISRCPSQ